MPRSDVPASGGVHHFRPDESGAVCAHTVETELLTQPRCGDPLHASEIDCFDLPLLREPIGLPTRKAERLAGGRPQVDRGLTVEHCLDFMDVHGPIPRWLRPS